MVAFAMTAMVACGDKENNDDNGNGGNGNNNTPTEAAVNTMILNGTTYQLESHYELSADPDRSYAGAETVETAGNGDPLYSIIADVESNGLNFTYDLTQSYEDAYYYFNVSDPLWNYHFGQDNHGEVSGTINDESYDGSIFSEGTMTITRDENVFVYKVNGVLKDGQTVSFHISVPASEWVQPQGRKL